MIFFSLPPSKRVGYIFPLFPAFAIIVGPWLATYRFATATIGGAICVCAFLVTAYVILAGPIGLAKKLKKQIAHQVVFVGQYLFDNAVILDRTNSYLWGGMIGLSARQIFPIQSCRQFADGREFDPTSAHTLIGEQDLKAMLSEGNTWRSGPGGWRELVPQNAGLIPAASRGGHTWLRTRH